MEQTDFWKTHPNHLLEDLFSTNRSSSLEIEIPQKKWMSFPGFVDKGGIWKMDFLGFNYIDSQNRNPKMRRSGNNSRMSIFE